jgi:hypothetical protein
MWIIENFKLWEENYKHHRTHRPWYFRIAPWVLPRVDFESLLKPILALLAEDNSCCSNSSNSSSSSSIRSNKLISLGFFLLLRALINKKENFDILMPFSFDGLL